MGSGSLTPVTTSKREGDKNDQDIWLVSWNGREHTPADELGVRRT